MAKNDTIDSSLDRKFTGDDVSVASIKDKEIQAGTIEKSNGIEKAQGFTDEKLVPRDKIAIEGMAAEVPDISEIPSSQSAQIAAKPEKRLSEEAKVEEGKRIEEIALGGNFSKAQKELNDLLAL